MFSKRETLIALHEYHEVTFFLFFFKEEKLPYRKFLMHVCVVGMQSP